MTSIIETRDNFVTDWGCGATQATWMADISRRSYKAGVLMPLALMALGVAGEAAEVLELFSDEHTDRVGRPNTEKLTNELGDTLWYVNAMVLHSDLDFEIPDLRAVDGEAIQGQPDTTKLLNIAILAGKISDRVKKTAWHGKVLDVSELTSDLLELTVYLLALGQANGIGYLAIATYNMDKLNKRYPGGKFVEGGGVRESEDKGRTLPHVRR